ncbi:MAG: DAK2 domain-containing protein, partial [Oscillospiraceae bacterium]|nr:DAK2 domain-containing protein [Oscillospiraceae bacterium]
MIDIIDGAQFATMIRYGSAALQAEKQAINDLNVFPVPDGDTGTNMSMTISAAVTALADNRVRSVGEVAHVAASALLRGARGNSGVILSLLFRGLARELKEKETMDGVDFAAALSEGVAAAYGAVMKPAEGTILTVSRLAAERAAEACMENASFQFVLEHTIQRGEEALADTVNQNPVLKKAGVVDAGGKGFVVILSGMLACLLGEPMARSEEPEVKDRADFAEIGDEDITFAFDTVYIVRKASPDIDLNPLRAYLNSIGDSLVIAEDDEAFKVHVHTDTPGVALTESQKYGTLELAKIENMRTQQEELAAGRHVQSTDDLDAVEQELEAMEARQYESEPERVIYPSERKYGFVAVAAGEGLESVFRDLGVDGLVSGGQTMNPATEDLLKVIDHTPAEVVYVLPNNKNIIMAAQQCIPLCEERKVVVIETKTVPQGIAAMMAVDLDAEEDALTAAMIDAAHRVETAQITYAARDSDLDGFNIHAGDYLALLEGKLHGTSPDIGEMLTSLAHSAKESQAEFVTIFYGEDVNEEQAAQAEQHFA